MLWRCRGGYYAEVKFNPDIDLREFGSQFGPGMYNAVFRFNITKTGAWHADFDFKFEQIDNPYDDRERPPAGRKGPFYAQDYSRMMSNTAHRARKLAKPTWSEDTGRGDSDFWDLLVEEEKLNSTVDFSFDYHYTSTGDWGNASYVVNVPNKTSVEIPEKETMFTIPISSIKKKDNGTSTEI
jgi:hypothetical protein